MTRLVIYSFLLFIIIFLVLKRIGAYDSSVIKVDNFIFKKPFLYRNLNEDNKIKLDNYDSTTFIFMSDLVNNSVLYSIRKVINKDKFKLELKYDLNINDINITNCYIKRNYRIVKDSKVLIEKINIYKYPYSVSLNEINKNRSEETIEQVCEKNQIINIKTTPLLPKIKLHPKLHPSD